MYTLSLDEVGKFESAENNPKFIGGLIYDDADDIYELSLEKKRIRSFYQTVLRKLSNNLGEEYPYPKSIHWDNNKSEEQNKKTSKIVKGEIDKYLPEFLKYGTINGKNLKDQNGNEYRERKGEYYIYCILKSDAGKSNCLGETEKNLLKSDDVAANLYFHMADEMLGRMVFNNPVVKSNENFKLEIATRITQTFKKGEEKTKEFANFNPVRERDNGKPVLTKQKEKGEYYEIGNIDIYRTIISKYIVENNNKNINIVDLLVESIDYNNKPKICKYEMLYMADSICSYLSYNLEKLNNSVEWLNEIQKRCEKIFDTNHIFVFGYDDIDVEYSKANNMLIANDYYGALSVCFDSEKNISDFSKFYLKRWFPFIENRIKSSKNIIALEKSIKELNNSQFSNNYNQDKGIYILKILEESLENIDEPVDSTKIRKIQALLDISGLTAYRHIGDWKTAEKYFKRIEENNTCLTLDEYLGVKRSLWVCYCDGFMWDKALKCAEEILDNQEIMEDARRNIFPKSNKMSIDSGKACSICGQSLAYLRNDRAEKSFLKALECYEKETPDYYITLSYLLHFYIDNGEETKYKEYSKEYFGQNISLNAQFEYIFKEGLKNNPKFNLKYALFVFLKALYNFNKSSVTDSLWGKIRNVEEYVNKNYKKHIKENERWILEGHPSELIYKYIMLIAINRGDNETVIKCKYKLEKSLKNKAELIDYINYFSLIEVENERGNIKERNKMIREFAIRLKKESPAFRKIKIDSKPSDLYSSFKEKFTYMYC